LGRGFFFVFEGFGFCWFYWVLAGELWLFSLPYAFFNKVFLPIKKKKKIFCV
jgi:hypothetical protein